MKFNEELFMPCPSELHRRALRDPSQVLVHCETCYPDDSFGRFHVRAGPVVEICSIKIKPIDSNLLKDGKEWQIYGVVQVTDGDGDTYHYFNKEYNDPEIIAHHLESPDGLLSLSLTDPVFMPYPVSELKLNLMDRVRNLELAKGTVRMNFDGNSSYEKDSKVEEVMGKDGICSVLFNRFPVAIIAEVFYVVLKEDGLRRDDEETDVDDVVDTYGSIIAECPSNYGGTCSTTLFHAEEDNPVKTEYGTSFELPRSLVVVPAYGSALVIKSSLWGINIDDLVFPVRDTYYSCRRIMISEDRVIQVDIAWVPAYPRKHIKSIKKSCGARPSLDRRVFRSRSLAPHPSRDLMEIFSVNIVSNVDEVLSLHGYVEVQYGPEIYRIFEKDEFKCSKKITSVETNGPHEEAFASGSLFLKVDLRDKQDKVFCKGHIGWTSLFLEKPFSWYGKRICSIIPCERGFAAVHYSIFTDGIEAQLKFLFSCNDKEKQPSDPIIINISGTIFSTYGDCDYSTPYQREHYRSLLFSNPVESPSELSLGCDGSSSLQLLKSVVAMSLRSSVIVEVDLRASAISPKTGSCVEALKGVAEFYVGSDTPWTIQSRDYSITMSIVWY